jgi:hypothetical protein
MIGFFKKLFAQESQTTVNQVDFSDCWVVTKINDHSEFLQWLINAVPNNSIWSIDHVFDQKMLDTLCRFEVDAEVINNKKLTVPRTNICVRLSETSKPVICKELENWDFKMNAIHQHIYQNEKYFFTAYDNLHPKCTELSLTFEKDELKKLSEVDLIEFHHSNNG